MWSNSSTERETFRVLNFISKVKESSWKSIQEILVNPIVTYDKDNKLTKKLFSKLEVN